MLFHITVQKHSHLIPLIVAVLLTGSTSLYAESDIPLSIRHIETKRIDNSLVRIIKHNMEMNPVLEIERLKIPGSDFVDKMTIKSVAVEHLGNKLDLEFEKSSGVFIEEIKFDNGYVVFDLEFLGLTHRDPNFNLQCSVDVRNNEFSAPKCKINK